MRISDWSSDVCSSDLAHVMETQGRCDEGLAFMTGLAETWADRNSFMLTHNWWHAALFAIDADRPDLALRFYDDHVWGVLKGYSQDQVNAAALLVRLEFAGLDVRSEEHTSELQSLMRIS